MRFAGRVSAANYITAGKNAAAQSSDMIETARQNAPDYDAQVTEAIRQDAANYDNAVTNAAKVVNAGTAAQGGVAVTEQDIERRKAILKGKQGVRKAGMVAKAGAALGSALTPPIERKFRETNTDGIEKQLSILKEQRNALLQKSEKVRNTPVGTTDEPTDTPSQSGEESGSTNSGSQPISSYEVTGKKGKYSVADMTKFALDAGFSPDKAKIMGAIGMAESGGNATIDTVQSGLDPNRSNEYSVGLFQVNAQAHGDKLRRLGYTSDDLRDPRKAAQVAKMVYDEVGSFKPWSVYKSGKYTRYLQ